MNNIITGHFSPMWCKIYGDSGFDPCSRKSFETLLANLGFLRKSTPVKVAASFLSGEPVKTSQPSFTVNT